MYQDKRSFKYFELLMAAFVTVLLCSNLVGASKVVHLWGFTFGAAVLFFPLSYIFGDVLTEVYGYARSRKVVWAGFGAMIFATFMAWVVLRLPPSPGWNEQAAYESVFGQTYRIVIGSLTAYFVGEFANSFVLAKMKLSTKGKFLWMRTIGSTIVGEGVDSLIFYPVAFYAVWPNDLLFKVLLSNYVFKVLIEVVMTPVTYAVVGFLKREEHEDHFDYNTNFSPFSLET